MKNPGLERFPLGFWGTLDANLAPADQPAEWAEMGMTLTMGHCYNHGETDKAHFTAMLDSAQQHGVRIILCDKRAGARELRTLGEEGYRRQLQEVIDDWGTHPAGDGPAMGAVRQPAALVSSYGGARQCRRLAQLSGRFCP